MRKNHPHAHLPCIGRSPRRVIQFDKRVRSELLGRQDGFCWYCGDDLVGGDHPHLEHQRPISRDGADHIDNVVMSCAPCNRRKRTMTVEEYRQFLSEQVDGEEIIFHGERE